MASSDYVGVVYVPWGDTGAWKTELAKEMHAVGFEKLSRRSALASSRTYKPPLVTLLSGQSSITMN